MNCLEIYTDGSYSPTEDQGGIGIIVLQNGKEIYSFSRPYGKGSTNNKMELGAIIVALRFIKEHYDSITIYTDSMYCIGGAVLGWECRKNKALWAIFHAEMARVKGLCDNIKIEYVKAHADSELNNKVDLLAQCSSKYLLRE